MGDTGLEPVTSSVSCASRFQFRNSKRLNFWVISNNLHAELCGHSFLKVTIPARQRGLLSQFFTIRRRMRCSQLSLTHRERGKTPSCLPTILTSAILFVA